jgi:hypothetical protein
MSGITISYIAQSKLDLAEQLLKRKLTCEEKDNMYDQVVVHDQRAADRLVEHFRLTGHIAFIDNR